MRRGERGRAQRRPTGSSRGAVGVLVALSGLAAGYLVLLALLAYNSENVESPNSTYVVLAITGGLSFFAGLLGFGRRWPAAVVVSLLLVPLAAAVLGSTVVDLDTAG